MKEFVEEYGKLFIAVAIGGAVLSAFMLLFLMPEGAFYTFISKFVAFL